MQYGPALKPFCSFMNVVCSLTKAASYSFASLISLLKQVKSKQFDANYRKNSLQN